MKVTVDALAWINVSDIDPVQYEWLRSKLTLVQSVSPEYRDRVEPAIVKCYVEDKENGRIGIAREFFFEKVTRGHEIEYCGAQGTPWPDRADPEPDENGIPPEWANHRSRDPKELTFFDTAKNSPAKLKPEQVEAMDVALRHLACRPVSGGVVQCGTGWGKCSKHDTLVPTTSGLVRIGDIVNDSDDIVSPINETVVSTNRSERATAGYRKRNQDVLRILTQWGYDVAVTMEHPILCLSDDGPVWKQAKDISVGDFVAVQEYPLHGSPVAIDGKWGKLRLPDKMEPWVGRLLGYLIADGGLTIKGRTDFTKGEKSLKDDYVSLIRKIGLYTSSYDEKEITESTFSMDLDRFLAWCGCEKVKSPQKKLPWVIRVSGKEVAREFLRSYISGDGNVDSDYCRIEISSTSRELLSEVQLLLLGFGLPCSLTRKRGRYKGQPHLSWRIRIDRHFLEHFKKEIGLCSDGKAASLDLAIEKINSLDRSTTKYVVPVNRLIRRLYRRMIDDGRFRPSARCRGTAFAGYIDARRQPSAGGLRDFLEEFKDASHFREYKNIVNSIAPGRWWVSVTNISEEHGVDVCDITVPSDNWYIGGGIVCHNTVFAVDLIRRVKRKAAVLVHREFLMNQWRDRIRQFLPDAKIGIIAGNKWKVDDCHIVLIMVETIASWISKGKVRPEIRDMFGIITLDEVHRSPAPTWAAVVSVFNAAHRIGISARPKRSDGLDKCIFYHIGPKIFVGHELKLKPKIRRVWSNFAIMHPRFNQGLMSIEMMMRFMCASDQYNTDVVEQIVLARKAGRKILVFSHRVKHLQDLKEKLEKVWQGDGLTTSFFIGGMTEKQLKESEKSSVIMATYQMAKEALDIPPLDTVVLATPVRNPEQPVGRILRVYEGKKDPVVVDMRADAVAICRDYAESRDAAYERLYG